MSEIFDEINEELRQERAKALWKRYSKVAYGVAAVIVLGTVAYQFWQAQTKERLDAQATQFEAALSFQADGQVDRALESFNALADHSQDGIAMVARFKAASLLVSDGQKDQAVALYDALAQDQSIDSLYRDLALVLSVMHRNPVGQEKALITELGVVNQHSHPLRYLAREVIAGLALSAGDVTQAKTVLQQIVDDLETPQDVKTRAAELLRAIG